MANQYQFFLSFHQFKIELAEAIPLQVDGEAWQQIPGTITIEKLPYQSAMLEKSARSFFQRGIAHREVRDILQRAAVTSMDLTQLGTRRQASTISVQSPVLVGSRSLGLGSSQSPVSGVSHTLYIKQEDKEGEATSN